MSAGSPSSSARPRAALGTALYVHLPFCATKCPYCDFYSVPAEGQNVDALVDAVLAEARERAPLAPRTVFLGGGTPSLLSVAQLSRLLDGLHAITGFRDSAVEVTAECNPESLDRDKAACFLDHGVQRLSIGFQAVRDELLQLFGRVHDTSQSFAAYEACRDAGVPAVSVDLIYAAPGQTPADWEQDLRSVLALEPDHFSAYNLTFEEGTRFHLLLREGRLQPCAEEDELAMFHTTRALARSHDFEPYEISNYAGRGGACRHNLGYWRNEDYVGIGPSAVSKVDHRRSGNLKGTAAYVRAVTAGSVEAWAETLTPAARLGETWWLGLRLSDGVRPTTARRTAGCEERPDAALETARRLLDAGLLELAGGRFRLTEHGLPLADRVAAEFLVADSVQA